MNCNFSTNKSIHLHIHTYKNVLINKLSFPAFFERKYKPFFVPNRIDNDTTCFVFLPVLFFLLTMNLVRLDWRIIAVDLMTNLWACDVCDAPWSVARDTRVFPPGGASVGRHKPTTSVWRIFGLSRYHNNL